jgi:hypothetical protein
MEEGPVTPLRITRFSVLTTHRATNQHSEKANLYCGLFICVSFTMTGNYWLFGDPIILAKSTKNQTGKPALSQQQQIVGA